MADMDKIPQFVTIATKKQQKKTTVCEVWWGFSPLSLFYLLVWHWKKWPNFLLKLLPQFLAGENSLSGQWNTPVKMKDTQLHMVDDQRIDTCTGTFTVSLEHQ